jgi:hypothetical protein
MKKTKQAPAPAHNGKGFFALAGEAFHVLGEEIVEGKDKVVHAASEKFTAVKKSIQKITHKKAAPAVKKAAPKKAVKKVASKVAAAAATPKKAVKKAAKKVAKKVAKKKASAKKKA